MCNWSKLEALKSWSNINDLLWQGRNCLILIRQNDDREFFMDIILDFGELTQ